MASTPDKPSSSRSSETSIPPPPDPFPTYQTPYPQKPAQSNDPNPFVAFRKFADSQLSALLSQFSSLLGQTGQNQSSTSEHSSLDHVNNSFRQWQEQMAVQAAHFEDQLGQMVRRRHEEAEGHWKEVEQEWEERRMRNEQRMTDAQDRLNKMLSDFDRHAPSSRKDVDTELDLYEANNSSNMLADKAVKDITTTTTADQISPLSDLPPWSIFLPRNSHQPELTGVSRRTVEYPRSVFTPFDALLWWTGSRYSPMRLKNCSEHRVAELIDWDAAFEDLVRGEHTYDSHRPDASDEQQARGKAWGFNLLEARPATAPFGLFSDFASRAQIDPHSTLSGWVSDLEKALMADWTDVWRSTKPDSHSKIVDDQSGSTRATHQAMSSWPVGTDEQSPEVPISAHVTTHTIQRPDGTFETTKTIKTRFADGREECSESFEEDRPAPAEKPSPTPDRHLGSVSEALGVEKAPVIPESAKMQANRIGKGWFWN